MTSLLDSAPPAATATLKLPKKKGKGALLEVRYAVGLALCKDPDGPAVTLRLEAPKTVREELLSLASEAVHAGVAKSGLPYPEGGLGAWVVIEAKGPLNKHKDRVFPVVSTHIETAVADFMSRKAPKK